MPPQMATPYHVQSGSTIIAKVMNMKQQQQMAAPPPSKIILLPRHGTTPVMWCAAVLCFMFSLFLIVAGAVILTVFLVVRPRSPSFDAANASLNSVYLDAPGYLNGDMTLVANFSNPNRKIDVVFQYVGVELYFQDRLMAVQALQPFAQRRGRFRIVTVHMVASQVLLPPEVAMELENQVRSNRVVYSIRGTFKVQASFWFGHFTYWMYGLCDLELTAPPGGILVARRCRTK